MTTMTTQLAISAGERVVLFGPPGSGKTALARDHAEASRGDGSRVAWGSASQELEPQPLWHWRTAAESLGLPGMSLEGPVPQAHELTGLFVRTMASPPTTLVVLDDLDRSDHDTLMVLDSLCLVLPGLNGAVVATVTDPTVVSQLGRGWTCVDLSA